MATTTTNFGWDIPQSTDLVKDGATAIAALGQDIDTAFVDFKGGTTGQVLKKTSGTDLDVEWGTPSSGLTLINTTSFSGVTSQSFNNVFTTDYDYYKVILLGNTSSNSDISLRMRVGGVDASSAVYNRQQLDATGSTVVASRTNSQTSFQFGAMGANVGDYDSLTTLEISRPFNATPTTFLSQVNENRSATGVLVRSFAGLHAASTSYDGFTIIASFNMTATISIFGYNK